MTMISSLSRGYREAATESMDVATIAPSLYEGMTTVSLGASSIVTGGAGRYRNQSSVRKRSRSVPIAAQRTLGFSMNAHHCDDSTSLISTRRARGEKAEYESTARPATIAARMTHSHRSILPSCDASGAVGAWVISPAGGEGNGSASREEEAYCCRTLEGFLEGRLGSAGRGA